MDVLIGYLEVSARYVVHNLDFMRLRAWYFFQNNFPSLDGVPQVLGDMLVWTLELFHKYQWMV